MIDSDEMKRKRSFLMNLKMIKKVWEHKIYKYTDEIKNLSRDIDWNQDFLHEETFLKKIQKLEMKVNRYRKAVKEEKKSHNRYETNRNEFFKVFKEDAELMMMLETPVFSIAECEQKIKNLELAIVKTYDRREQLRAEEIRLEKLKRRYKKLINKIRKLDDFLDKEYKKLRQERNESLISLFNSSQ